MHVPPAVMVGTHVVAYAEVDESVTFVQRNNLAVDGEWLGRVPLIAVCRDFKTDEVMVMFCDASWTAVAIAAGYPSVDEAQKRTEHSYLGIGSRWQLAATSRAEAHALHLIELEQESCAFCGRTPREVDMMFGADNKICNHCIENFHKNLHAGEA